VWVEWVAGKGNAPSGLDRPYIKFVCCSGAAALLFQYQGFSTRGLTALRVMRSRHLMWISSKVVYKLYFVFLLHCLYVLTTPTVSKLCTQVQTVACEPRGCPGQVSQKYTNHAAGIKRDRDMEG
jgi:hypothetical protein